MDIQRFLDLFWVNTVDGLTVGSIYALVALGYTMVYGVLRLINFAHSEVFMAGTVGAFFVAHLLGPTQAYTGFALVAVLLACLLIAMAVSAGTAVALERVAYRPLRKRGASRLAALISAIGASIALQELFALVIIPRLFDVPAEKGRDWLPTIRIMDKRTLIDLGFVKIGNDALLIFVAAIAMMVLLDQFVSRTKTGRGIRATAQDPETAVLMGVNIDRIVLITFLVGGAMAGVAGMLYFLQFEQTKYFVGFIYGIKAFTAAVLGGIGNLRGALVGGLFLGFVEQQGAALFGGGWKDVIAFVILVAVLMFRPTGILGESLQQAKA